MKLLKLNIVESKFQIFLEFIRTLDYVEILEDDKKNLDDLQRSLHQVKKMQEDKIGKQSAEEFLNDL
ncbi:MAG: hypothetical protein U9R60_11685 [Bacteroidota bacterium]|nr:hypothetical protein [Bacteroidota bacterium]